MLVYYGFHNFLKMYGLYFSKLKLDVFTPDFAKEMRDEQYCILNSIAPFLVDGGYITFKLISYTDDKREFISETWTVKNGDIVVCNQEEF